MFHDIFILCRYAITGEAFAEILQVKNAKGSILANLYRTSPSKSSRAIGI